MNELLAAAKLALRITTTAFDTEILALLDAAALDLGVAGVSINVHDALYKQACITYVKMHFGQPDDYDRLKKSYDEQKKTLLMASGYTTWSA